MGLRSNLHKLWNVYLTKGTKRRAETRARTRHWTESSVLTPKLPGTGDTPRLPGTRDRGPGTGDRGLGDTGPGTGDTNKAKLNSQLCADWWALYFSAPRRTVTFTVLTFCNYFDILAFLHWGTGLQAPGTVCRTVVQPLSTKKSK